VVPNSRACDIGRTIGILPRILSRVRLAAVARNTEAHSHYGGGSE